MLSEQPVNRRTSIRFRLVHPLDAEICLSSVRGKPGESGSARVMLIDIGKGGCRFRTYLKVPPRKDVEWRFHFTLRDDPITLSGRVVWSVSEGSLWLYGVKWNGQDVMSQSFVHRLHRFILQQIGPSSRIHGLYRKMCERDREKTSPRIDYTT